ncbi:single-stranded DNA-binding protein, partial [bacterium]|nr:single-stranded DNA-binding protein [bacterium]
KKGSLVGVEGRLAVNKWKAPDGTEIERYIIRGQNVRLMGSKRDSQQA